MWKLLLVPTALWLGLVACSNSGLGETESGTTGDTGATAAADCPWVGTWALDEVNCGTFSYDAWFDDHERATLEVSQSDDGGCDVEVTIEGDSCERDEDWHFGPPVGISVVVTFEGILDCRPNNCVFGPSDPDECSPGDLADDPQALTIDTVSDTSILATGLLAPTAQGCTLDVVTAWNRED
jgi:hypothetical protein